ncbi:Cyclin-L2 [Paramyrothecium foliicola]|nr:Cyclin-L2 [Paramyrothecium foliicola]
MSHLANPLATASQLYNRSSFSALPQDLQEAVFVATQCLTQAAGLLLELPQSVTAQASVILARYWLVDSPMTSEFSDASAAAIYLVSKMGPLPRPPRDVSNVYAYLLSSESALFRSEPATMKNDPSSYFQTEADYFAFHNRVLALEARMLYALSFDTHVALPHPLAVTYLQTLDFLSQSKSAVSQRTMQYLNTALLSPQMLYLTHQPHALATAAIYNTAKDLGAKMPDCEWWEVFDVDREELGFLVVGMRSVESLLRKRREELPQLAEGMITRKMVEKEVAKRGSHLGNSSGTNEVDEERELMRQLDRSRSHDVQVISKSSLEHDKGDTPLDSGTAGRYPMLYKSLTRRIVQFAHYSWVQLNPDAVSRRGLGETQPIVKSRRFMGKRCGMRSIPISTSDDDMAEAG